MLLAEWQGVGRGHLAWITLDRYRVAETVNSNRLEEFPSFMKAPRAECVLL